MISSPLISVAELLPLLGQSVLLDARNGQNAATEYSQAHVHDAIRVDLETDLSELGDPAEGGRHPLPALGAWFARLGRWGVTPATPVIIYDAAGGGMAAARAWWMLRAIGHGAVAVVDGGWQALRAADVPIDDRDPSTRALDAYPSRVVQWPVVDADLVESARVDPTWRVIDARAPARYGGRTEPLDPVAGHIPGADNFYWQSQLGTDGALQPATVLRERYARILGDVPPERVVCYCGSGVTACHLLLAMEGCGLSGAQLYVGSWSEWCRQERPRAPD
jgi:thiosulfate/3-mercaptopyruvate sulfurtransferase